MACGTVPFMMVTLATLPRALNGAAPWGSCHPRSSHLDERAHVRHVELTNQLAVLGLDAVHIGHQQQPLLQLNRKLLRHEVGVDVEAQPPGP